MNLSAGETTLAVIVLLIVGVLLGLLAYYFTMKYDMAWCPAFCKATPTSKFWGGLCN